MSVENTLDEWEYEYGGWNEDDGIIECYRHKVTDETMTVDEYNQMKKESNK